MKGLRILRKATRYMTSLALLLTGGAGLAMSAVNPLEFISPFLRSKEQLLAQSMLSQLYAEPVYLASLIGASIVLSILAFLLLVQNPVHAFKSIGRGVKSSPKALLRSPITTYKSIVKFRNWMLEKVEYLQSESAKWKTTFNIVKSPYSLLRTMGFTPQMAASLLIGASAVTGGVVVNETVFAERSFNRGDSGVYGASLVGGVPLDVPTEYVEGSNTLRIDLGSTPVREITIENVSVGTVFANSTLPSGEDTVIKVGGVPAATNFVATRLEIGTFIYENSRCRKVTFSDINAHTIIVRGNASDGQSVAPSPGTARMRAVGGGHHQADAMITSGGTYDRIWLQAPSSAINGKIGTLRLSNLYTKGGDCSFTAMDIGTLIIELNETGSGTGFGTKEFIIATTVTGANITVIDNVEVSITEPATI
jgi:hypothetical protein